MSSKDLMIGDWVHLYLGNKDWGNYEVDVELLHQLECQELPTRVMMGYAGAELSRTRVEPIPLTPEILEKNGFEPIENKVVDEAYIFDRNEFEEPDIIIRRFDFNDSFVLCTVMDNTAIISIAYVHELQHALRLLKIEKEIVL